MFLLCCRVPGTVPGTVQDTVLLPVFPSLPLATILLNQPHRLPLHLRHLSNYHACLTSISLSAAIDKCFFFHTHPLYNCLSPSTEESRDPCCATLRSLATGEKSLPASTTNTCVISAVEAHQTTFSAGVAVGAIVFSLYVSFFYFIFLRSLLLAPIEQASICWSRTGPRPPPKLLDSPEQC